MLEVKKKLKVKKKIVEVKNVASRSEALLLENLTPTSHRITRSATLIKRLHRECFSVKFESEISTLS